MYRYLLLFVVLGLAGLAGQCYALYLEPIPFLLSTLLMQIGAAAWWCGHVRLGLASHLGLAHLAVCALISLVAAALLPDRSGQQLDEHLGEDRERLATNF